MSFSLQDGTVRLWDLNSKPVGLDQALPSILVMKTTNKRGVAISQDCAVHSLTFIDANNIAGACADGSVQLWDSRYVLPSQSSLIYSSGQMESKHASLELRIETKARKELQPLSMLEALSSCMCEAKQLSHVRLHDRDLGLARILQSIIKSIVCADLDPRKLSEHIKRVDIISSDQKRPQLKTLAFGGLLVTTAAGMEDVHYLDARNLDVIHSVSSGQPALTSLVCHDTLKQVRKLSGACRRSQLRSYSDRAVARSWDYSIKSSHSAD